MSSNINPAIPPFGTPTTSGVRENFLAAKNEIEDLQTAKLIRCASGNESVEGFQACAVNNVPQLIVFNQQIFNNGSVFTFDSLNSEFVISETGWYGASISYQVVRKIAGGGIADFIIHSQLKEPAGAFTAFPGGARYTSLSGSVANQKQYGSFAFVSRITVSGTRIRWMQTCTDVSREVGVVSYPVSGDVPSAPAIQFSIWKLGE